METIKQRPPSLSVRNKRSANAWALAGSGSGFFTESDIEVILKVYIIDANALGVARRSSAFDSRKSPLAPLFQIFSKRDSAMERNELRTACKRSPLFLKRDRDIRFH